jgi:hypothetical protein
MRKDLEYSIVPNDKIIYTIPEDGEFFAKIGNIEIKKLGRKKCDNCIIGWDDLRDGFITESNKDKFKYYSFDYCPRCGTKIDWDKLNEKV